MTKTYGPPFVVTKSWIILNSELDNEKGRWQFSYTTFMISNKFPGAKKRYESIESIKTTKDSRWSASGELSDDSNFRKFWNYIWKLNVPHKIRHFTWRACKNILPTKDNLVRRKVLADGCCDECKS